MVLYGFTFFANGMVLHRGVKVALLILAACQAFCWLLTIPMYRYGKRIRAFVSRRLVFWLFVYWRWWYWDLPPSKLRIRAGSMLIYGFLYSQCEISGPFGRNWLLGNFGGESVDWLGTQSRTIPFVQIKNMDIFLEFYNLLRRDKEEHNYLETKVLSTV